MEMKCQSFECMQYSFTGISLGSFVTTVTLYAMLMKHSSFGEKKIVTSSRYTNVHESHVSMGYKILKFVFKENSVHCRWSYLRRAIRHYPQIKEMLAQASKCAVCGESFLNTWLECVRFVDAREVGNVLYF